VYVTNESVVKRETQPRFYEKYGPTYDEREARLPAKKVYNL
jgi:hypothetical protein